MLLWLITSSFDGETKIPEPIMVPTIRATPLKSPTCERWRSDWLNCVKKVKKKWRIDS